MNDKTRKLLANFVLSQKDEPVLAEAIDNPLYLIAAEASYSYNTIAEHIIVPDLDALLKGIRGEFLSMEKDDRMPFLIELFNNSDVPAIVPDEAPDLTAFPYLSLSMLLIDLFDEDKNPIPNDLWVYEGQQGYPVVEGRFAAEEAIRASFKTHLDVDSFYDSTGGNLENDQKFLLDMLYLLTDTCNFVLGSFEGIAVLGLSGFISQNVVESYNRFSSALHVLVEADAADKKDD